MNLDKRIAEARQTTYAIDRALARARDLAEFVQAGNLEGETQRRLVQRKAVKLLEALDGEGAGT